MSQNRNSKVLMGILEKIELPDSAYEKAEKRYSDLGGWLHRPESNCAEHDPHVFPQGSFRLGTAIRPDDGDEYDLDMGCNLKEGLSKNLITQKQLKHLVGAELELYRHARGIKEGLVEKQRCWRLNYADDLSFHMDIVPCIPEEGMRRQHLKQRMEEASSFDAQLARSVSELAVSITDNAVSEYDIITDKWRISNPEGYALWFEHRMKTASSIINERELSYKASIESLPYYKWKTPLQSVIQLLKRHRDTMFKDNDDAKPISAIITTIAAQAYNGEANLQEALVNISTSMENFVNNRAPYVPNPVNPDEDYGDKWELEEYQHLNLRENFNRWIYQLRSDVKAICSQDSSQIIVDAADRGFDVSLDKRNVEITLGLSPAIVAPVTQIDADNSNARPWRTS